MTGESRRTAQDQLDASEKRIVELEGELAAAQETLSETFEGRRAQARIVVSLSPVRACANSIAAPKIRLILCEPDQRQDTPLQGVNGI